MLHRGAANIRSKGEFIQLLGTILFEDIIIRLVCLLLKHSKYTLNAHENNNEGNVDFCFCFSSDLIYCFSDYVR